ncbi:MAG: hypothetical protein LIP08_07495 [Bacteroides sp.]|nr:hypothetical protein [Bacteroides sp.]
MDQKKEEKNIFIETDWEFIERLTHTALIQESMKDQWKACQKGIPDDTTGENIREQIMRKIED